LLAVDLSSFTTMSLVLLVDDVLQTMCLFSFILLIVVGNIVDIDCAFGQLPNNCWLHVIVYQSHVSPNSVFAVTTVIESFY
jgi:hypothetical protein